MMGLEHHRFSIHHNFVTLEKFIQTEGVGGKIGNFMTKISNATTHLTGVNLPKKGNEREKGDKFVKLGKNMRMIPFCTTNQFTCIKFSNTAFIISNSTKVNSEAWFWLHCLPLLHIINTIPATWSGVIHTFN